MSFHAQMVNKHRAKYRDEDTMTLTLLVSRTDESDRQKKTKIQLNSITNHKKQIRIVCLFVCVDLFCLFDVFFLLDFFVGVGLCKKEIDLLRFG